MGGDLRRLVWEFRFDPHASDGDPDIHVETPRKFVHGFASHMSQSTITLGGSGSHRLGEHWE
jgi:hypothetical protein